MKVREYVFAVFPIYRLGTCTVCIISQQSQIYRLLDVNLLFIRCPSGWTL